MGGKFDTIFYEAPPKSPTKTTTTTTVDKNKKIETVRCGACLSSLPSDHAGIRCMNNHHLCPGRDNCSSLFVANVLFEASTFPPKCALCALEIEPLIFERQLSPEELSAYLTSLLLHDKSNLLAANEMIIDCPFCKYFEICEKDKGHIFMFCKNSGSNVGVNASGGECSDKIESCKRVTCMFCRSEVIPPTDDVNEAKTEMESHFICAELSPSKLQIDNAIYLGCNSPCPECGLSGIKNDACTHMTCIKCQALWCYICGFKVQECDKAPNQDYSEWENFDENIHLHNIDWKTNEKRCPMYLYEIKEIDDRWPGDPTECVNFFVRLRTMKLIKAVVDNIGRDKYNVLEEKYASIQNNGFPIEDCLATDTTVIKRNA